MSPVFQLFDPLVINYAAKGNRTPLNKSDIIVGLVPSIILNKSVES